MLGGDSETWEISDSAGAVTHADGYSVTVDLVGPAGQGRFIQIFTPAEPPTGGVVVCSPLYSEATRNERREFLAGLAWARHGLATVRFHYRGWGHSEGDPETATFDWLVQDALSAAEALRTRAGIDRLTFLGTRFGAIVAAAASSDDETAPLVFWQPTLSGSDFYREVFRARQMGSIARGQTVGGSSEAVQELQEQGFIDAIGHRVSAAMFNSAHERSLSESISGNRAVLLVQMSRADQMSPAYASFLDKLRDRGCEVTSAMTPHDGSWWFGKTPGDEEAEDDVAIQGAYDVTTPFLATTMGGR